MPGNVFGKYFRIMTFGESHGPLIGVVIDGVKPNLKIDVDEIQDELNRRRPGQSKITSSRQEKDKVEVVSGIFEGKTTGTPICLLIKNEGQAIKDYDDLKNIFRPGHAGYTFFKKYGIYDYRGGGRASGRETAVRVAAGAIAKQLLRSRGIKILAYTKSIGDIEIKSFNENEIDKNAVRAPDSQTAELMIQKINEVKAQGDSIGGIVEIKISGLEAGYGEPVFDKLEADFAKALMSIGAVRGFEIGSGFKSAIMLGSECNDQFITNPITKKIETLTNNSGGVQGGISNGSEIVMRIAVKPTSSISKKQKTVTIEGNEVELEIHGRHDPCICPRIVPVAEAMVALVLIDHILMQEALMNSDDEDDDLIKRIDTVNAQIVLLLAMRTELIKKIKNKNLLDQTEKFFLETVRELEVDEKVIDDVKYLIKAS